MIFEWGYRKLMHKPNPIGDLSAMITGVLLAFVCPVTLPYWTILIGDFFAIVVVKQLFGGMGQNFMNPALAGRAFLMMSYPVPMTTWVLPGKGRIGPPLSRQLTPLPAPPPGRGLHEGRRHPRCLSG